MGGTLSQALKRLGDSGDAVTDAELVGFLTDVDWSEPPPLDDVWALRQVLFGLEQRSGVGPAHRAASAGVLAAVAGWELVGDEGHRERLLVFGLSPDGRYLAVGSQNDDDDESGVLQVWETASGRCVNTIGGIEGGVGFIGDDHERNRLRWHPSGKRVGTVFWTNVVGVFDPFGADPVPTLEFNLTGGWDSGPAWCFSPDGGRIAVAVVTNGVMTDHASEVPLVLVDISVDPPSGVDSAAESWVFDPVDPDTLPEGAGVGPASAVDWSVDGERITGIGRTVQVVDATTGAMTVLALDRSSDRDDGSLRFSPDARLLAMLRGNAVVVLEVVETEPVERFRHEFPAERPEEPFAVVWSDDGDTLAVLTTAGVAVFGAGSGELLRYLPVAPVRNAPSWDFGDGTAAAFDAAGARLAVLTDTDAGRVTEVWDLAGPERICVAPVGRGVRGIMFADAGRVLVGFGPGALIFHHAVTGQLRNRYLQPVKEEEFPGDHGDPMAFPGGHAADALPRRPSFRVPTDGTHPGDSASWEWITAFDTGLVVCPPQAHDALRRSLSFVYDRRHAWPAHWAIGTDRLEVHEDWAGALASSRLPTVMPDAWRRQHVSADRRVVDRAAGIRMVDPPPLWGSRKGPPDSAPLIELPTRDSSHYAPDRTWSAEEITEPLVRSLLGSAVIVGAENVVAKPWALVAVFDFGRGNGPELYLYSHRPNVSELITVSISGLRSLATVRYLGHPDDPPSG